MPDTEQESNPTPGKPGAPPGNLNGLRHGLRAAGLPPGCANISKAVNHFRRQLEQAVIDQHGEITVYRAACVSTAHRAEIVASLAFRWLRQEFETLSPSDRARFSDMIVSNSEKRDRAIEKLKLDHESKTDLLPLTFDAGKTG